MEQLLSIKTIPLKYELEITPARLEYTSQKSEVVMHHEPGRVKMHSSFAKLNINTYEARNSVCPTTKTSIAEAARKGIQASKDYTAQSAMEGKMLANAKPGDNVLGTIAMQKAALPSGDFGLAFIPTTGPEIKYIEPTLDVQYQADKLQFDVRVTNRNVEFVPGDVSMNITQWPDVVIEYLGKPMYVPPSAEESPFLARA